MTVHKAMSYKWPHVVFATTYDQGRNNREYFKFVYTGISRASEVISLVKWKNLSPFSETVFVKEASGVGKKKRTVVARIEDAPSASIVKELVEGVIDADAEISSVDSKNYLEIVHIEYGENRMAIGFDYNGKGEIFLPRLLKGDSQAFESLVARMAPSEAETSASPLGHLYEHLNRVALNGISISLIKPLQYQDRISLEGDGASAEARVVYDKRGLVTRFELISGSETLFGNAVESITSYYDWEAENDEGDL